MKNRERFNSQIIEKKGARIVSQITKSIQRVVNHKTLEEIIRLTEEEEGID